MRYLLILIVSVLILAPNADAQTSSATRADSVRAQEYSFEWKMKADNMTLFDAADVDYLLRLILAEVTDQIELRMEQAKPKITTLTDDIYIPGLSQPAELAPGYWDDFNIDDFNDDGSVKSDSDSDE